MCDDCGLVFVPLVQHLDAKAEKARYDLHRNTPEDKGYVRFLNRLVSQVTEKVQAGRSCLDFGSGPSPVMAHLLEQHGYITSIYDPFYANTPEVLSRSYDLITCCEVAEHLSRPGRIFQTLTRLLTPGGVLAVMTQPLPQQKNFPSWHYKNDLTHVCFYSCETFSYIADTHDCSLERPGSDIFLLIRK